VVSDTFRSLHRRQSTDVPAGAIIVNGECGPEGGPVEQGEGVIADEDRDGWRVASSGLGSQGQLEIDRLAVVGSPLSAGGGLEPPTRGL
jgi:hypothetical protein